MSSTQSRRPTFYSSTSSSLAKRQAPSSENAGKAMSVPPHLPKKRAPLANITNNRTVPCTAAYKSSLPPSTSVVACTTKIPRAKKATSAGTSNAGLPGRTLPAPRESAPLPVSAKPTTAAPCVNSYLPRNDETASRIPPVPTTCSTDASPSRSEGNSVSMDESMSTCDSFKSPEVEYMDSADVPAIDSIGRKTFSSLCISDSDHAETAASICNRDALVKMEIDGNIVSIDDNFADPQLCASMACDIYKHMRASEAKKRPSTDFMEKIQKDINANMRAILVDWLVEVAEEYRLVPDTLYLTVNYIDRYLSGNMMDRQRLQLLGVACMMIASKYEEICAPQVEEFCYITDNTYFKDEVLQMESNVLNYLKFEMTAPTAKCFLRRFVRAAQGVNEVPSLQLEHMANYIAELSLLEYSMLCYAPSLIAASAIFLAKYILFPSKRPWNSTLQHYTLYQPSDLYNCVKDLHGLCSNTNNSSLPAIREKYSQHKYKCVAKKYCPSTIPAEFFYNQNS